MFRTQSGQNTHAHFCSSVKNSVLLTVLLSAPLAAVPATGAPQYVVGIEGVYGARGTAWLNYSPNTSQPPAATSLLPPASSVAVTAGTLAPLAASLGGSPPLRFS